jgi:hypothetical protein
MTAETDYVQWLLTQCGISCSQHAPNGTAQEPAAGTVGSEQEALGLDGWHGRLKALCTRPGGLTGEAAMPVFFLVQKGCKKRLGCE